MLFRSLPEVRSARPASGEEYRFGAWAHEPYGIWHNKSWMCVAADEAARLFDFQGRPDGAMAARPSTLDTLHPPMDKNLLGVEGKDDPVALMSCKVENRPHRRMSREARRKRSWRNVARGQRGLRNSCCRTSGRFVAGLRVPACPARRSTRSCKKPTAELRCSRRSITSSIPWHTFTL